MVGHLRRRRPRSHERRRRHTAEPRDPRELRSPSRRPSAASAATAAAAGASRGSSKLRLFWILLGLGALAIVSTIFGMMMAVASDLPQIENRAEYKSVGANSYLFDDHWRKIGIFAPANSEVIDTYRELGPMVTKAVIAVEDKRFWTDPGVDIKGIARAFIADVTGGARPGRFDHRAAVRQERAGRRGQPDGVREAARGGAGLPPHPRMAQVEDHHRVPELDLLRQRGLRRGIGRARVLRQAPRLRPQRRLAIRPSAGAGTRRCPRAPRSSPRPRPRCWPA